MDIRKSVEKHPLSYIVGCMVAAATLAASVTLYFGAEQTKLLRAKHQSEVDELNSKLASIRRGIPGNEFFDVRRLLYSPNSKTNMPPTSSVYFPDGFYAPKSQDVWTYKDTNELEMNSDLMGISPSEIPQPYKRLVESFKVHMWKAHDESPIENDGQFTKMYTFISLEKMTFADLQTVTKTVLMAQKQAEEKTQLKTKNERPLAGTNPRQPNEVGKDSVDDHEQLAKRLDEIYRADLVGTYFAEMLKVQLESSFEKNQKDELNLVAFQKVGNVLYAQFAVKLNDVRVGGRSFSKYYVTREVMMISTPEGGYLVTINVPSEDPSPRSQKFAAVSAWLSDFRVVVP